MDTHIEELPGHNTLDRRQSTPTICFPLTAEVAYLNDHPPGLSHHVPLWERTCLPSFQSNSLFPTPCKPLFFLSPWGPDPMPQPCCVLSPYLGISKAALGHTGTRNMSSPLVQDSASHRGSRTRRSPPRHGRSSSPRLPTPSARVAMIV